MSQGAESHGGRGGCGAAVSSSAPPGPGERGSTLSILLDDLLLTSNVLSRLCVVCCCSGAPRQLCLSDPRKPNSCVIPTRNETKLPRFMATEGRIKTTNQCIVSVVILVAALIEGVAAEPSSEQLEFFEKIIRPLLTEQCYDCHSNNTRYPWYIHIQPIGWWMASHIKDAKDDLNFSEFRSYNQKQASHKLEEIVEVLEDGVMPLKSYVWLHSDAKVTTEETQAIKNWVQSLGIVSEKE